MRKQFMRKSMSNSFLVGFLVLLLQCTRLHAWDPHGFRGLEEANENETAAPTASNATISPTNLTSLAPTIAPTNATENVTTASPTLAPTAANTSQPTKSPTPGTPAPTASPATNSPTPAPTSSPSGAGTPSPAGQHKGISFLRFVEKTIAYLILLVLALLGFGAFMANRYRIYFFLRGVWYTILQMDCTLWLIRKLRLSDYFGYQPVDQTLNSSIFENELNEGLLMRETDT